MSLTTDANFTSNSNNELVGSGKFYTSIESLSVVGMALYESGPATITAPYWPESNRENLGLILFAYAWI